VWQEAGLKPHRLELYLASDNPELRDERRQCDRTVSGSAAARGRVLCGRKCRDSGTGSFGPAIRPDRLSEASVVDTPVLPLSQSIVDRRRIAADNYRARPYGGRVYLFKAESELPFFAGGPELVGREFYPIWLSTWFLATMAPSIPLII
jgi:hypothetical protein